MSELRRLMMAKKLGGGKAEIIFIQDEDNANLRPRWGGVLYDYGSTLPSNSAAATNGYCPILTISGGVVAADRTLFGTIELFPRYLAYYKYSGYQFPIAHLGATYGENSSVGFYGSHPLRNISAQRKHIFDLQEISQLVPSTTPSGRPLIEKAFAFRTGANFGCIVGCDDLKTLQDYLNSIP